MQDAFESTLMKFQRVSMNYHALLTQNAMSECVGVTYYKAQTVERYKRGSCKTFVPVFLNLQVWA